MKKLKIFLIFLLFVNFISRVNSSSKLDYYLNLFKDWDFDTYSIILNSEVNNYEEIPFSIHNKEDRPEAVIFLHSQLNEELIDFDITSFIELNRFDYIFIICDHSIFIENSNNQQLNCNKNPINEHTDGFTTEYKFISFFNDELAQNNNYVLRKNAINTKVYFIPETYLVSAIYREELKDIFKEEIKSYKNKLLITDTNSVLDNQITSFPFNKDLFKLIIYLLSIILIILTVKKIQYVLQNTETVYASMSKFISKYIGLIIGFLLFVFVILLILQIPLYLKWVNNLSSSSILYSILLYFSTFLNYKNLNLNLDMASLIRFGFFVFNIYFVLITLLLFISISIKFFTFSYLKVTGLSKSKINIIFFSLISIMVLLVSALGIENNLFLFFSLFSLSSYIIVLKDKKELKNTFNFSRKLFISLILFTLIFIGYSYRNYTNLRPVKYDYTKLLSDDNSDKVLPKLVEIKENTLFKDYFTNTVYKLYANDFLIFSQDNKIIINKPVSNLNLESLEKNFIILNSSEENVISEIISNKYLKELALNMLKTNTSESIYISDFKHNNRARYFVDIITKCADEIKSFNYYLTIFSENATKDIQNDLKKTNFMHFPGCSKDETISFSIPMTSRDIPNGDIIISLVKSDADIKSNLLKTAITIRENTNLLEHISLDLKSNSSILFSSSNNKSDEVITSYYFNNKENNKSISFEVKNNSNISETINYLITNQIVSERILLWSPETDIL